MSDSQNNQHQHNDEQSADNKSQSLNTNSFSSDMQDQQEGVSNKQSQEGAQENTQENAQENIQENAQPQPESNIDFDQGQAFIENKEGFMQSVSSFFKTTFGKVLIFVIVGGILMFFLAVRSDDSSDNPKQEKAKSEKAQSKDGKENNKEGKNNNKDGKDFLSLQNKAKQNEQKDSKTPTKEEDKKEQPSQEQEVIKETTIVESQVISQNGKIQSSSTSFEIKEQTEADRKKLRQIHEMDEGTYEKGEVAPQRQPMMRDNVLQGNRRPPQTDYYRDPSVPQVPLAGGAYPDYPRYNAYEPIIKRDEDKLFVAYATAFTYEEALYSINIQIVQLVDEFLKTYSEVFGGKDDNVYGAIYSDLENKVRSDIFNAYRKEAQDKIRRLVDSKAVLEQALGIEKSVYRKDLNIDFDAMKETAQKQIQYLLDKGRLRIREFAKQTSEERAKGSTKVVGGENTKKSEGNGSQSRVNQITNLDDKNLLN